MDHNVFISGANSLYVLKLDNRLFFFFGDQHYAMENNCEDRLDVQCDIFDYRYKNSVTYNSNCWTIGSLFDEWFTYNNYNDIKTDFYLETPFIKGNIRDNVVMDEIADRRDEENYEIQEPELIESGGWLNSIEAFFDLCFLQEKHNCKYGPNVKFHYSDVRMRQDIKSNYSDIYIPARYVALITEPIQDLKKKRIDITSIGDDNRIKINSIIHDLYSIFMLYNTLWDINIVLRLSFSTQDIRNILNDIHLPQLTPQVSRTFINTKNILIKDAVTRDNILMHRTAAEFNRLNLNHQNIAGKLVTYIMEKLEFMKTEIRHDFDNLYQDFLKLTNIPVDQQPDILDNILDITYELSEIITAWVPWMMDIYTLSRIFLQQSEQVVVYAGYIHVAYQVEFLKYLGAKTIIEHPPIEDNRCISSNLSNILNVHEFRKFYRLLHSPDIHNIPKLSPLKFPISPIIPKVPTIHRTPFIPIVPTVPIVPKPTIPTIPIVPTIHRIPFIPIVPKPTIHRTPFIPIVPKPTIPIVPKPIIPTVPIVPIVPKPTIPIIPTFPRSPIIPIVPIIPKTNTIFGGQNFSTIRTEKRVQAVPIMDLNN